MSWSGAIYPRRAKRVRYCPTEHCITILKKSQKFCLPCSISRTKERNRLYAEKYRADRKGLLQEELVFLRRHKKKDSSLLPSVMSEKIVHEEEGDWNLVCRKCNDEPVKSVISLYCNICDPDTESVEVGGEK